MAMLNSMTVQNSMFLFEVVVESVQSFVESRVLVVKCDFSNVFSLELKDPKLLNIKIPEPPPLPPEPPGKKGKKKKPPKPKKGKKGKGKVEEPPPEPAIQAGQSVLITSNPELLTQEMKNNPMVVSVWSKEENLTFIGSIDIAWDPVYLGFLQNLFLCEPATPPVVKDFYNVFQEGTAKIIAKICMQVKLSHLTDRVVCSFRSLSEDPAFKKFLYTGMNSKVTSYISTLKTTDFEYQERLKELKSERKIQHTYVKAKAPPTAQPQQPQKPIFASYKNAPSANLPFFKDGDYCCMGHADPPPDGAGKAPETCPDIDFICDYVRKIITSCNDNMRMLTPRPTIRPRIRATDLDRLCYCRETSWPQSKLAERFKKEVQTSPCPVCVRDKEDRAQFGEVVPKVFDLANIRGPCGRHDCKIARDMKAYIADLYEEDNKEFKINDLVGPCGSKSCTLVDRIKDFLTHKGAFAHGVNTAKGLSTQCTCVERMQKSLVAKRSCDSVCSIDCKNSDESVTCGGKICPHKNKQVYQVYYFTVEYEKEPGTSTPGSPAKSSPAGSAKSTSPAETAKTSDSKGSTSVKSTSKTSSPSPTNVGSKASSQSQATTHATSKTSSMKFKYCSATCPSLAANEKTCGKDVCFMPMKQSQSENKILCLKSECPDKEFPPSPADSNIVLPFDGIRNPCCVKTCPVAKEVREFIAMGLAKRSKSKPCLSTEDPCYCDCTCSFKFSTKKTTYCPVCGGYECLGDDMKNEPEYAKPHPCPVYHKLYDRSVIKTKSPWPEENEQAERQAMMALGGGGGTTADGVSVKSGKAKTEKADTKNVPEPAGENKDAISVISEKKTKKKVSKSTAHQMRLPGATPTVVVNRHKKCHESIEPVPKNMGWLWTAEDIPGLKTRPKWRPGAANKILVRRYRTVREGVDIIAKKKRALLQRKKKIEMKPTLVVKKHDGEYTVQMEVFKKYSKERLKFQYPYDEKPPLIYTVGKTEATKKKIQRQRDRRERRESRRKSKLLQSTFRDKCQEICLKAYNQSIGVLPLPNPNNPECACDVPIITAPSPIVDSCSCSDSGTISSSDTDGDDWIIEFTPPLARWDPKAKHPPTVTDNETQYTYLDYKVKVLDKQGNPVPRFFKGLDGEELCSDLGGFWGPGHVWCEINKDGYIGPDNRWIPLNFMGPDGVMYSSEDGHFTDATGQTWKLGIDGYVDKDSKWVWYPKKKSEKSIKTASTTTAKGHRGGRGDSPTGGKTHGPGAAAATAGGKGAASAAAAGKGAASAAAAGRGTGPAEAGKGGATGAHSKGNNNKGKDKIQLSGGGAALAPSPPHGKKKRSSIVATVTCDDPCFNPEMMQYCDKRQYEYIKNCVKRAEMLNAQMKTARTIEALRALKLQAIMDELSMYDDLAYSYQELRPQNNVAKTSRAVNTPQSPNTVCTTGNYYSSPQKSYCTPTLQKLRTQDRC